MRLLAGHQIRLLLLAAGVLVAGFFWSAEPARAHGGDGAVHADTVMHDAEDLHAENGHQGHCHGGAFCSGAAVLAGTSLSLQPDTLSSRQDTPVAVLRPLAVTFFDPPPPRSLA